MHKIAAKILRKYFFRAGFKHWGYLQGVWGEVRRNCREVIEAWHALLWSRDIIVETVHSQQLLDSIFSWTKLQETWLRREGASWTLQWSPVSRWMSRMSRCHVTDDTWGEKLDTSPDTQTSRQLTDESLMRGDRYPRSWYECDVRCRARPQVRRLGGQLVACGMEWSVNPFQAGLIQGCDRPNFITLNSSKG